MATANGISNGGSTVLVLYKVVNAGTDPVGGLYNAFQMPRGTGVTLAAVKQHCVALRTLNHAGADGYHWRVRVDDKAPAGSDSGGPKPPPTFSWWDIQDESARLPVKEATASELEHLFSPAKQREMSGSTDTVTAAKAAKGAMRTLGKAMNAVAGTVDGTSGGGHNDFGPRVSVIAFKLLDLIKMHDDFVHKHPGGKGGGQRVRREQPRPTPVRSPAPVAAPRTSNQPPPPQQASMRHQSDPVRTPAPAARSTRQTSVPLVQPPGSASARRPQMQATAASRPAPAPAPARKQQEHSLMDFGNEAPTRPAPSLHHATSSPPSFSNETRAERMKKEYAAKQKTQNRVWDDVDQRWVVEDSNDARSASSSSLGSSQSSGKKVMGVKLDPSNAVGKSASVQAAVHQRVNDMRQSQQKALEEVREREQKKKQSEAEEDAVRKRLEPKITAWSEEHGKKKQLRALLANLHTILWPEAKWKPVSLGDILDANKCKRCYHKATLVVHPDKTHHLDAEKRFLAKRIFDSLTQAKTEFDNSQN